MRKRLIDTLRDVIEAERVAAELRRAYGGGAERYCEGLIAANVENETERERLQDVRRALRWV
jgi:hypothetical protein